uniref:Uncharacterized protein n=1 Tax=Sinocyclocheilus anshuiensis TaxID=1608454 RepID=A0A671Q8K8_9TELE
MCSLRFMVMSVDVFYSDGQKHMSPSTLVLNALAFRNKYATHPYLPEDADLQPFTSAITEVEWPGSDSCTAGPHGEITVCSVDGHAKLILSSSGEEFTVDFICRSSRSICKVTMNLKNKLWRYDTVNPDLLEQEEDVAAESGLVRSIVDGVKPMVEISPGDGSVIRSNGVLANYFTHYKAAAAVGCVYYLCGLPPDIPGQLYSVQSVVTRASR